MVSTYVSAASRVGNLFCITSGALPAITSKSSAVRSPSLGSSLYSPPKREQIHRLCLAEVGIYHNSFSAAAWVADFVATVATLFFLASRLFVSHMYHQGDFYAARKN